jgi:hypothetical protein
MYASLLPWAVLMLNLCTLSMPFVLFSIFKCQSANPDAPAPFTLYQDVTSGLNLCAASVYVYWSQYLFFAYVLMGAGCFMATYGYLSLRRWYRENPTYTARLFE